MDVKWEPARGRLSSPTGGRGFNTQEDRGNPPGGRAGDGEHVPVRFSSGPRLPGCPRSPMAHVRLPVCCCSSLTMWAFCVGAQRQQTTAGHWQASSTNSCS